MDKQNPKIVLKTPETKWLGLGAIAACVIPMAIGISMITPFIEVYIWDCHAPGRPGKCWSPNHYTRNNIWAGPTGLTFIFGTMFTAYFSAVRVSKKSKLGVLKSKWSIIKIGLKWATLVHFIAAIFYFIYLVYEYSSPNTPIIDEDYVMVLGIGSFLHGILWVIVTLPLSIMCSSIFYYVAMEKE